MQTWLLLWVCSWRKNFGISLVGWHNCFMSRPWIEWIRVQIRVRAKFFLFPVVVANVSKRFGFFSELQRPSKKKFFRAKDCTHWEVRFARFKYLAKTLLVLEIIQLIFRTNPQSNTVPSQSNLPAITSLGYFWGRGRYFFRTWTCTSLAERIFKETRNVRPTSDQKQKLLVGCSILQRVFKTATLDSTRKSPWFVTRGPSGKKLIERWQK